ncbi:hypothetical protein F5Y15DRAFT_414800 [Xylariaceae sp. FL0016]|nr:hypothetical protein F5Y15DRAFT_414800 [Xylariaceae sp. FL0016]
MDFESPGRGRSRERSSSCSGRIPPGIAETRPRRRAASESCSRTMDSLPIDFIYVHLKEDGPDPESTDDSDADRLPVSSATNPFPTYKEVYIINHPIFFTDQAAFNVWEVRAPVVVKWLGAPDFTFTESMAELDNRYSEALLIASRGEVYSGLGGCNRCATRTRRGPGGRPFSRCLRVPGYWGGACANCVWAGTAAKCAFHRKGPYYDWNYNREENAAGSDQVSPDTSDDSISPYNW